MVQRKGVQKDGLEAIGAFVARDFGEDGVYVGTVVSCSGIGRDRLYRVKYSDGDQEDLDQEEYNYAYALKLQRDGWELEEADVGGGTENVNGGVPDADDDTDDDYVESCGGATTRGVPLSPYEKLREENMKRNAGMVDKLGLSNKRRRRGSSQKKMSQKMKV